MNPKDKIYEAYAKSLNTERPIDEGTLASQDYVTINKFEFDDRAIVYLTNAIRGIYDLVQNMKNLKRVLNSKHYNGLSTAILKDIKKGL